MKRGKDDEKIMGPMFPRLHVNDTEKGGPRAPPRNKMALYEQLSIPSQRFNHAAASNYQSNASNSVPAASSSQGNGFERNLQCPNHMPSTPSHPIEKFHSHPSRGNLNTSSAQLEPRKKAGDEDDFIVPVFVQSGMGGALPKAQNGFDREKSAPFTENYMGDSTKTQNTGDNGKINHSSRVPNLIPDTRNQSEENLEVRALSRGNSVRSSTKFTTRENIVSRPENAYQNQQNLDPSLANVSRLGENGDCSQQELTALSQQDNSEGVLELTQDIHKGSIPCPISDSRSREDLNSPNEPEIDTEFHVDKTCRPLHVGNGDKCSDASENSMVDSVSVLDISPDDVVGVIGQKHFWKARRAIVNQQRLFAVQVFELHRLIKVQRLIASSPHLLLEGSTYIELGAPPTTVSPPKKLPSEFVVSPPVHVAKRKDDSKKQNHKMECSAENAIGKTSFSSVKNGSQPSNYGPYTGNPPPAPVGADAKMSPWCLHHSVGHQWLIPVMSPSEGLVYKPYSTPGFMGSAGCGGCGHFGPSPLVGNFINPAYGIPGPPHQHQGTGFIPGVHGYFPPYGMQAMNPAISGSGQTGQVSGGGANFNTQHQSSCNVPNQKSGSVAKFQASKDTELQGSSASSPGEREQRSGHVEGRDVLPLFPVSTGAPGGGASQPQPPEMDMPARVIRVVPHNPRSATESAARIFKSIQEERKQQDSN